MKKTKILLICSFSNEEIREHIHLRDLRFYNCVRKIFSLPKASAGYGDFAPWDTFMIRGLAERDDIELYVINAHPGMSRSTEHFICDGVNYWCLRIEVATLLKHLISSPELWHKCNPLRPKVRNIVKHVHPDIIALVGAENPHISGTVLEIKGYPIIVKCQTIYNNPERGKHGYFDRKNAFVEESILKSDYYFSVNTTMHNTLFRRFNQSSYNLFWDFGQIYPELKTVEKKYDFINFAAGMSDRKGFHDSIKALAIVKQTFPDVTLNLTGRYTEEMKLEISSLAKELGVLENISFTQFFEKQSDLFQHIVESRFAVLPCKLDYISGTISQSMHYGLPLVCYETDGTKTINTNSMNVLVAKHCDVEDLAQKMMLLMQDDILAATLRDNALKFSRNTGSEKIIDNLVSVFKAVIDNYSTGNDIPQELLFNE